MSSHLSGLYCKVRTAKGTNQNSPFHREPVKPCTKLHQYHPTSGLMQILHFDWLRYQGTIRNGHRVAKFAGFSFVFFSPNKYFFNLQLLTLLLPFLSDQLGDTKTIRPFVLKGHGSIAHSASLFRATGLIVNYSHKSFLKTGFLRSSISAICIHEFVLSYSQTALLLNTENAVLYLKKTKK